MSEATYDLSPLGQAAVDYARRGYWVFPVEPRGKKPLGRLVPHGLNQASNDAAVVREWWSKQPNANIGISCGPSKLVVIDVDPRHGGDESIRDLLAKYPELDDTLTGETGGGGWHLCFLAPAVPIANSTGSLAPGLDVRGVGGYIVAPPSIHPDTGNAYEWMAGYGIDEKRPAKLPLPLVELLSTSQDDPPVDVAAVLQGVGEGERDWELFRLAAKFRYADIPRDLAYEMVGRAAAACVPPFPADEARKKVDSAYRYAAGKVGVTAPATEEARAEAEASLLIWVDGLDNLPELEWSIADIAPKESLGVLVGKEGHAKTFVLLDMACCIATGTPWHGKEVAQGTVVYVFSEGLRGLKRRIRAWEASNRVKADNIAFVPRAIQLLDEMDVEYLIHSIRKEAPGEIAMVVIDTLARALVGGDENDQKDVGMAIAAADRIKRALNCSIWFAHHTNRAKEYRGSSVIPGSADAMILVRKGDKRGVDDHVLTLHCEKMKDAEEFEDIQLVLSPFGNSVAVESENSWAIEKRRREALKEDAKKVMHALAAFGEEGAGYSDWLRESGFAKATFQGHRTDLLRAKVVIQGPDQRYRVAPEPDPDLTKTSVLKRAWSDVGQDRSKLVENVVENQQAAIGQVGQAPLSRGLTSDQALPPDEEIDMDS